MLLLWGLGGSIGPVCVLAAESHRPNILLILFDDLGYNDLGANGNPEAPTPRLDRFAAEGVHFTRHYADSTCRPSRAALLTGKMASRNAQPAQFTGISPETRTLAESLKGVGYSTHHIGKWHLGDAVPSAWPSAQGFDHWFGFLHQFLLQPPEILGRVYGRSSYRNPWLQADGGPRTRYEGHLTDILTRYTLDTIESFKGGEAPWFINLWYLAPHGPVQPAPRYEAEYPRSNRGRYYALVRQLDDSVGRILDALDAHGMADNTLVVMLSDNGGTNHAVDNNHPFFGSKVSFFEGGVRTPLMMRWPGRFPKGLVVDSTVSEVDVFPTVAAAAGAPIPADIDGVSLLDIASVREGSSLSPRALYWELSTAGFYAYSVLSADGRWRLVNDRLFDLQSDPSGRIDVAAEHPDVVDDLTKAFREWQGQAASVDVEVEKLGAGRARVRGDGFRRIPGTGAFTFSLGVSPELVDGQPQVLVWHQDVWSLEMNDRGLVLRMGGVTLVGPSLPAGRCTPVTVSAYFYPAHIQPENRMAYYQLYVDGILVANTVEPQYEPIPDRYDQPTLLGHAPGGRPFAGTLRGPLIHNHYLGIQIADRASRPAWLPAPGSPPPHSRFLEATRSALCARDH